MFKSWSFGKFGNSLRIQIFYLSLLASVMRSLLSFKTFYWNLTELGTTLVLSAPVTFLAFTFTGTISCIGGFYTLDGDYASSLLASVKAICL